MAKVTADVTGVTDVVNCVTHPGIGSCAMAVATVAMYAVPGAGLALRAVDEGVAVARIARAARTADRIAVDDAAIAFRTDTSHTFRDAAGHLAEDTAENRALSQSAINPGNLRSTINLPGGSTLAKYFQTLPDGREVWVEVRNGTVITNGGFNAAP